MRCPSLTRLFVTRLFQVLLACTLILPSLALLEVGAGAAVEGDWTATEFPDDYSQNPPAVAAGATRVTAAWLAWRLTGNSANGRPFVAVRASSDAALSWSPTQLITTESLYPQTVAVAASSTATVVAAPLVSAECVIGVMCEGTFVARYAGGAWTSSVLPWGGDAWPAVLRNAAGRFYYLATTHSNDTPGFVLMRSGDDGATWAPLPLPAPPAGYGGKARGRYADLVVDGSHVTALYVDEMSPDGRTTSVWAVSSLDGGDHFAAPVQVEAAGTHDGVVGASLTGRLVLAWTENTRIVATTSVDNGATFGPATEVGALSGSNPLPVLVTATTQEIQLVTVTGYGTSTRYVTVDGSTWTTAPGPDGYGFGSIAAVGDRVYIGGFVTPTVSRATPVAVLHSKQPPDVPTIDAVLNPDGLMDPMYNSRTLAGRPITLNGRGPAASAVALIARDALGTRSLATVTTTSYGRWSYRRPFAYNTVLTAKNPHGSSAPVILHMLVKVTVDSVAYQYKDSRGRCVVRFAGGSYPYIPGAPVYLRAWTNPMTGTSVPVGYTRVTQYGTSGRYAALFGLACGQRYDLYALISGRGADGRLYAENGVGGATSFTTPR